jgi:hypothetical protein
MGDQDEERQEGVAVISSGTMAVGLGWGTAGTGQQCARCNRKRVAIHAAHSLCAASAPRGVGTTQARPASAAPHSLPFGRRRLADVRSTTVPATTRRAR